MRTYTVDVTRARRVTVDYNACWRSSARIRQFVILVFRKYFGGLEPTFHWHKDGFMAEASDKRGNIVTVTQENWSHHCSHGSTTMPRPFCPMVIRKGAA